MRYQLVLATQVGLRAVFSMQIHWRWDHATIFDDIKHFKLSVSVAVG